MSEGWLHSLLRTVLLLSAVGGCGSTGKPVPRRFPQGAQMAYASAESVGLWCGDEGLLLLSLTNSSREVVEVIIQEWNVREWRWPGTYSYWYEIDEVRSAGGLSGTLACSCSHGPCPEPCGGPDVPLPLSPGEKLTWPIPIEAKELPRGTFKIRLDVSWRESRAALVRRRSTTLALTVDGAEKLKGCQRVSVAPG